MKIVILLALVLLAVYAALIFFYPKRFNKLRKRALGLENRNVWIFDASTLPDRIASAGVFGVCLYLFIDILSR